MYNPLLDDSQFHNDEVTVIGESGLDRINYVRIDYEKAAARNRGYILENIAREKAYQEKLGLTSVV